MTKVFCILKYVFCFSIYFSSCDFCRIPAGCFFRHARIVAALCVCTDAETSVLDFLLARCCRRLRYAAVCFALATRAGFTSFTRRPYKNPLQHDRSFLRKNTLLAFCSTHSFKKNRWSRRNLPTCCSAHTETKLNPSLITRSPYFRINYCIFL